MADAVPPNTLFNQALSDPTTVAKCAALEQKLNQSQASIEEGITLSDLTQDLDALTSILVTSVNGGVSMPEQAVQIEYLKNDQKLRIPSALGMSPLALGPSRVPRNATLQERYWRLTQTPFATMFLWANSAMTSVQVREALAAINLTVGLEPFHAWDTAPWQAIGSDVPPSRAAVDLTFMVVSAHLQFNCDIRDYGFLMRPDATVTDADWVTAVDVPQSRLLPKLKPYSIHMIAALNYGPTHTYALGAWVRAIGVSIGVLPATNSLSVSEIVYTLSIPSKEHRMAIATFERNYESPLIGLCANILAMFGIFHLHKDHTFRTGDANMDRIGTAYINALRTGTSAETIESMKANKEAVVRTAAHPFGLSQTYWLARVMYRFDFLTSPLAIRINASPPPVQRVMIVDATVREWDGMPAGRAVSGLYFDEIARIRSQASLILASPPHYSSLFRLYGVTAQSKIASSVEADISAIMPAIYGYVTTTHVNERGEKDGLGYALSLKNVERDAKGLVTTWKNAWEKYIMNVDAIGLMEFVNQIRVEREVVV